LLIFRPDQKGSGAESSGADQMGEGATVNENEGNWESHRFGGTPFVYKANDETKPPSDEAIALARDAVTFIIGIVEESKTPRAALLKLACMNAVLSRWGETSADIAKRFGVSDRAVQQVTKDIKAKFMGRSLR
jgi:hypothetical protein